MADNLKSLEGVLEEIQRLNALELLAAFSVVEGRLVYTSAGTAMSLADVAALGEDIAQTLNEVIRRALAEKVRSALRRAKDQLPDVAAELAALLGDADGT